METLAQHIAHRGNISLGNLQVFAQLALTLGGLFGENMRGISLPVLKAISSGAKAFGRALEAFISGHGLG